MSGYLDTRLTHSAAGNEDVAWQPFYYTLSKTYLSQYVDEDKTEPALNVWALSINCTVFETSLKSWSFQLVTSTKAFHGQGNNELYTPRSSQAQGDVRKRDLGCVCVCMYVRSNKGGDYSMDEGSPSYHCQLSA